MLAQLACGVLTVFVITACGIVSTLGSEPSKSAGRD
tara:strand:- start:628 stop:735 length:108 start_codon:yes stop_codon:yes gene_type:complete